MGLDYDRRRHIAWQLARQLVGLNAALTGALETTEK
jgi:hypothetical protein